MPCEIDFTSRGDERRIYASHVEGVYLWVGDRDEVEEDGGGEVMIRSGDRVN